MATDHNIISAGPIEKPMSSNTSQKKDPSKAIETVSVTDKLILFLAQGLGSGRIPVAPGTWGTVVGVVLVWAMLQMTSPWVFLFITIVLIPLSIFVSGKAEKILGSTDPGSVVIDEIIAMPICWLGPVILFTQSVGTSLQSSLFANSSEFWLWMVGSFVVFRILDIWKPWPAFQIQNMHGGAGVTLDDVISAIYTSLIMVFIYQLPI